MDDGAQSAWAGQKIRYEPFRSPELPPAILSCSTPHTRENVTSSTLWTSLPSSPSTSHRRAGAHLTSPRGCLRHLGVDGPLWPSSSGFLRRPDSAHGDRPAGARGCWRLDRLSSGSWALAVSSTRSAAREFPHAHEPSGGRSRNTARLKSLDSTLTPPPNAMAHSVQLRSRHVRLHAVGEARRPPGRYGRTKVCSSQGYHGRTSAPQRPPTCDPLDFGVLAPLLPSSAQRPRSLNVPVVHPTRCGRAWHRTVAGFCRPRHGGHRCLGAPPKFSRPPRCCGRSRRCGRQPR